MLWVSNDEFIVGSQQIKKEHDNYLSKKKKSKLFIYNHQQIHLLDALTIKYFDLVNL